MGSVAERACCGCSDGEGVQLPAAAGRGGDNAREEAKEALADVLHGGVVGCSDDGLSVGWLQRERSREMGERRGAAAKGSVHMKGVRGWKCEGSGLQHRGTAVALQLRQQALQCSLAQRPAQTQRGVQSVEIFLRCSS